MQGSRQHGMRPARRVCGTPRVHWTLCLPASAARAQQKPQPAAADVPRLGSLRPRVARLRRCGTLQLHPQLRGSRAHASPPACSWWHLPQRSSAFRRLQAECAAGRQPSWNKNLTCEECVRKVDKEIRAREPDAACEDEAGREFLKGNCEASQNTLNCTHAFEAECGADRPPWTANLTCDECVRQIDTDIRRRDPSAKCDEVARVFAKDGCKDSQRSLVSHPSCPSSG